MSQYSDGYASVPREPDFDTLIDNQRITSLQVGVAISCAAVCFCDAIGTQVAAFAGPALRDAFNPTKIQLGALFSIGLSGTMIGSFAIGVISDRIGRKTSMVVATAIFGAITFLMGFATEFWQLQLLNLLNGLALGAALPNAYVLAAEYSPKRHRRLMIGLMMVGFTLGGLFAGLVGAPLMARFGWQAIFFASGSIAMAVTLLGWFLVPESLYVLLRRGDRAIAAKRILSRITEGPISGIVMPVASASISVGTLLKPAYRVITLGLWFIAIAVMLELYLFLSWTPILLRDAGMSIEAAVSITAMFNLGAVVSAVAAGWLMDRLTPFYVLAALLAFGGAAMAAMTVVNSVVGLSLVSLSVGLGLGGAIGGTNLLASTIYPSSVKVTGSGWAVGMARLGAIIGPLLGALALTAKVTSETIYLAAALPAIIAAPLCILLAHRTSASAA